MKSSPPHPSFSAPLLYPPKPPCPPTSATQHRLPLQVCRGVHPQAARRRPASPSSSSRTWSEIVTKLFPTNLNAGIAFGVVDLSQYDAGRANGSKLVYNVPQCRVVKKRVGYEQSFY